MPNADSSIYYERRSGTLHELPPEIRRVFADVDLRIERGFDRIRARAGETTTNITNITNEITEIEGGSLLGSDLPEDVSLVAAAVGDSNEASPLNHVHFLDEGPLFALHSITAGAGLTGGGALNTDPTINVVAGDDTVIVSPDSIAVDTDAVVDGYTVTAGAGLTGGGALHTSPTINVAALDTTIVVEADGIRADLAALSPLTTSGDLWGYDTADARVPVGSDDQLLFADSTDPQGVAWKDPVAELNPLLSHSALDDLDVPADHAWAFLHDGTRAATGPFDLAGFDIDMNTGDLFDVNIITVSPASLAATTGNFRWDHGYTVYGRNSGNSANIRLLDWGADATNTLTIGQSSINIRTDGADFLLGGGSLEEADCLQMSESASAPVAPTAGEGTWWVRNDVPSVPMFTDDVGADHNLLLAESLDLEQVLINGDDANGREIVGLAGLDFDGTVSTAGTVNAPHGWSVYGRDNGNANDRALLTWGVAGTDILRLGNGSEVTEVVGSTPRIIAGSTTVAESSSVLWDFNVDLDMNSNDIDNIRQARSTTAATEGFLSESVFPSFGLYETGVTADTGRWRIAGNNGQLLFQTQTDAGVFGATWASVVGRTDETLSGVDFNLFVDLDMNVNDIWNVGDNVQFDVTSTPVIDQETSSGNGADMIVRSQIGAQSGDTFGGDLRLIGGEGHASGGENPSGPGTVHIETGTGDVAASFGDVTTDFFRVLDMNGEDLTQIGSFRFDDTEADPGLSQPAISGAGADMTIRAQGSSGAAGGDLILASGDGTSDGTIHFEIGSTEVANFEAAGLNLQTNDILDVGYIETAGYTVAGLPSPSAVVRAIALVTNASTGHTLVVWNGSNWIDMQTGSTVTT